MGSCKKSAECFRIQTDLPDVPPIAHILRSSSPEIVGYDLLDLRLLRHVPFSQTACILRWHFLSCNSIMNLDPDIRDMWVIKLQSSD